MLTELFSSCHSMKTGLLWTLVEQPTKSLNIEGITMVRDYANIF
jgi:hypothetical protein